MMSSSISSVAGITKRSTRYTTAAIAAVLVAAEASRPTLLLGKGCWLDCPLCLLGASYIRGEALERFKRTGGMRQLELSAAVHERFELSLYEFDNMHGTLRSETIARPVCSSKAFSFSWVP